MIYLMSGYLCEFQEGNFRLKGDERIVRSYSSPIKKLSRQTGKSASRVNRFSHFMSSVNYIHVQSFRCSSAANISSECTSF